MHPHYLSDDELYEIEKLYLTGMLYKDIADKTGRSVKSIEGVISRHRHKWVRDFNFPHILHAKRFGA